MKKLGIGCLLLLLLPVVIVVVLIVIGSGVKKATREPAPSYRQGIVQSPGRTESLKNGDAAVVTEQAMLGVTADDYERINHFSSVRDATGLAQMQEDERLFIAEVGTNVTIINVGIASHEVRVVDGPHKGRSGIIAVEFVNKPPLN